MNQWCDFMARHGMPTTDEALPAFTLCPLCNREQLQVYQDYDFGPWFACLDCFHGTLVELMMAVWQVDLPVARDRLLAERVLPFCSAEEFDSS